MFITLNTVNGGLALRVNRDAIAYFHEHPSGTGSIVNFMRSESVQVSESVAEIEALLAVPMRMPMAAHYMTLSEVSTPV